MKCLKFLLLFNYSLCIVHCTSAQAPLVKMWDKRFGGTGGEEFSCAQQTFDGGYIIGGRSSSGISGDKTQAIWWGYDYWIVKTDSLGNKQWDKDFGGTDDDYLYSIQQTSDGGFILGGFSFSGISGDKTQANWDTTAPVTPDYWIVKIDSLGNKQWDKDFGGMDWDRLNFIQQTPDGGFIFGGYSNSGIGGDKTTATWGNSYDWWIIKTDSLGNKLWDKDLGGTGYDAPYSVQQTPDGGFIFGGYSGSGISGDKTQPTWGGADYWIVKTDSLGNKQWDKDFGGTDADVLYSVQHTFDGGFILGGLSKSGIGGDKMQANWDPSGSTYDYWIVKTDSLGNKQWDKDLGGTDGEDEFGDVIQTADGGFLAAGTSYSPIGGNKTEANLGTEQTWVVKTDSLGNIVWDKTLFTTGHDEQSLVIQTTDGCYAIANSTNGGIGGYKTQPNWDTICAGVGCTPDYWIIKFCETLQANFTGTPLLCPGTCTAFLNLSFNAISYQWYFPGASPDTSTDINPSNICYANPGSYDVQLIASNAGGNDTLLLTNYITVYPAPPPQSIAQSGDTLFAIAGSAFYQWYFNTNIISGATNYFYLALQSGDYNVVATDSNGCEVEAVIYNVVVQIQAAVGSGSMQFEIYPNPVSETLLVNCYPRPTGRSFGQALIGAVAIAEISVYNALGALAVQPQTSSRWLSGLKPGTSLDISRLPSGMYWLEIKSGSKIFRAKFVKQ